MRDWGWPEQALPGYIKSHVHRGGMDRGKGEMVLVPTFRLPTLVHTRSGNAKYLNEISHRNPLWIHTSDAERLKLESGDLVRVTSRRGQLEVPARIDPSLRAGMVFMTLHFPDQAQTNVLTIDAFDPRSGTAEFKACTVRVERATAPQLVHEGAR